MRPYKPQNHITFVGMIAIIGGSIVVGIALGALAYIISNFFYLILIFPMMIGIGAIIPYAKIINTSRIRHAMLSTSLGLLTGLIIAATFYSIPYLIFRNRNINEIQKTFQVDRYIASGHFDTFLKEETGSSGLMGFMKFRAANGEEYSSYIMIGAIGFHLFNFSLFSPLIWIYWIIEMLFFSLPLGWFGYSTSKTYFNLQANDWYLDKKGIGEISIGSREEFATSLQTNDLDRAISLVMPEGTLDHPMLELYEQHSKGYAGDILVSVFQTSRKNLTKVNRTLMEQWEFSQTEFARLKKPS